jgi:tRNA pseudouridine13 synthase
MQVALKVCDDREKRGRVHAIFRNCPFLPTPLDTKMAADEACPVIVVTASKNKGRGEKGPQRRQAPWSGGKSCNFVKFVMEKTNLDSQSALSAISRMLHMRQDPCVAGTKDKRAITAQFVTVRRVEPTRLAQLTGNLAKMGVRIGNFEYAEEQLGLGDLSGNKFEIVLRGVALVGEGDRQQAGPGLEDVVREAVAQTREGGFLNYFGLQRFGTGATPTHVTGELLLCGKWKEALDSILAPGKSASEHVRQALVEFFSDRDATKALKAVGKGNAVSSLRTLLSHLESRGSTDYAGALQAMPKTIKSLYINAFHGYVWNNVVSERVRTHGVHTVLPGDLVIRRDAVKRESGFGKRKRVQQSGRRESVSVGRMGDPHVVTEEDIKEGRYSIDDVVLPLPGTAVRYPENSTAALYKKYTAHITGGQHHVKSFMAESYRGDYRHVLYRPRDLECKLYSCASDIEEIPAFDALGDTNNPGAAGSLAVVLRFYLPSSTYATMCIREITRMPTHVDFAKALDTQPATTNP